VAELFGFTSGDQLVRELLAADPMRDEIEGRTDQRMLERYGDLTDPEAIAQGRRRGDPQRRPAALRGHRGQRPGQGRRLQAHPGRGRARLRPRAGRPPAHPRREAGEIHRGGDPRRGCSRAAAAKGDLVTAATEKRNQLINAYAAKAAYEAQAATWRRRCATSTGSRRKAARKSMDADYREQIEQLLERFDLRKGQSLKAIDKRQVLAAWIEGDARRAACPSPSSTTISNEAYRKHYKDMTVDELRGLRDAVKNIAHLGRLKNKLLVAARRAARSRRWWTTPRALIRDKAYKTLPDEVGAQHGADQRARAASPASSPSTGSSRR
jgi:hypothetical protein